MAHGVPGDLAEMSQAANALLASPTRRHPGQGHTRSQGKTHARPHALDDASAFMAEDGGAARLRGPVGRVEVAVADAAGMQPDQDLVGTGRRQLELGHLERFACARKDSGDRPQPDVSPGTDAGAAVRSCIRRSSSIG